MPTYVPPQPFWRRAVAGVLDFTAAYTLFGILIARTIGSRPSVSNASIDFKFNASGPGFGIEGWPGLLLFAFVIAYFVVLGRTGGTIFQRLFGMQRAA